MHSARGTWLTCVLAVGCTAALAVADPNNPLCSLPALDPIDCNGNGVPDTDDLAFGVSFDRNFNGIPDECEFCFDIFQDSWTCPNGGFTVRYSSIATLRVLMFPPPDDITYWLNANVDGRWVVRNQPLIAINGGFAPEAISIAFDLGVPEGIPVATASASVMLSPEPLPLPPFPPPLLAPICESINSFGTIQFPDPNDPNDPNDFVDPNDPNSWPRPGPDPNFGPDPNTPGGEQKRNVRRRRVGVVDEPRNHCAPGAAARSLDWMNNLYCLNFDQDCDNAQELHDALAVLMKTSRFRGTTFGGVVKGIQRLINQKMLSDKLKVDFVTDNNPCTVFDAIAAGKDVIGLMNFPGKDIGHAITVIGATKCGDKVTLYFRDDGFGADRQNDNKADSGENKATNMEEDDGEVFLRGLGVEAKWIGFVAICPSRAVQADALLKWLDPNDPAGSDPNDPTGDPNDAIEGIVPRLERLQQQQPTVQDLQELKLWVTNALDIACYLLEQAAVSNVPPPVIDDLIFIKEDLLILEFILCDPQILNDPFLLQQALQIAMQVQQLAQGLPPVFDCNQNGVDDLLDIALGTSNDNDFDGIPDECQAPPCPGDTDGDGDVDLTDLANVLGNFGRNGVGLVGDLNGDGTVDLTDLAVVLAEFGKTCP